MISMQTMEPDGAEYREEIKELRAAMALAWEERDQYLQSNVKLVAEIDRLRAENARLLKGIRRALDYLNEARDGDASFDLEALLAGSEHEQSP